MATSYPFHNENTTVRYDTASQIPFRHVVLIGQGALGTVDEVTPTQDGEDRTYARKMIPLNRNAEIRKGQVEALEQEVTALQAARHEHVVKLVSAYLLEPQGRGVPPHYGIVMDPRAGLNLENCLTTAQELPQTRGQFLGWIRCLVNAVAFIHGRGIRHRDIKPENILVDGLKVLLSDFGISSLGMEKTIPTTNLGRNSARTTAYCSPDVEDGRTRGRAADIFSLGAVFLEIIATYQGSDELKSLRDRISHNGKQSFASKIDEARVFLDALDKKLIASSDNARLALSTVLALCRAMLRIERTQRPTAGDMCSWLSLKGCFTELEGPCSCAATVDAPAAANPGKADTKEALRKAYRDGHRLTTELLIEEGVRLSLDDELSAAAQGGLLDVVEGLVRGGADATNGEALRAACVAGHHEVAGFLLKSGADVNWADSQGRTSLHGAASAGHAEVVDLLLSQKADVNAQDDERRDAALCAVLNGHGAISTRLLDKAAAGAPQQ